MSTDVQAPSLGTPLVPLEVKASTLYYVMYYIMLYYSILYQVITLIYIISYRFV